MSSTMALDNCVRLSSICATARPEAHHPFCSKEKTNLSVLQGLKKPNLALSFFPRFSFSPSLGSRFRHSVLVCKARGAVDEVKEVTESSWNELVIESKKTVLVEFWAPWCGPCLMFEPTLKELAVEFEGKAVVLKLNTDRSPEIATKYGIRSIPTVLLFNKGEKRESVVGAVSKSILSDTIKKYLDL